MVRSCRSQRRLARLAGVERLEARCLLAADLGSAILPAPDLLARIEWQGQFVDVERDAWVVRSASMATSIADFGLPDAWAARPLGAGFFAVSTPGAGVSEVVAWAGRTGTVALLEPDFAITSAALPSDPSFGLLWGLRNVGQSGGVAGADIRAETAWNTTTGSRGVVVAVIDTGVDYTHPDLAANIWTNPREIAGDGIDNDGNGYVDDVRGWDFANGDADPMDDHSHGTHVAGTIGATGANGVGVTGVSWQVSIMPLKFMSGTGRGTTSSAIAAINYATLMRRDFGINVVATNNSWGGGGASLALEASIAAGGRAGVLFVAAAGNSASDNDLAPSYPASFADPTVITVAASDRMNTLAGFSSFGATSVDLVAPGASIYSTLPGGSYGWFSGTSMATPHVTGTIALLAAAAPRASADDLRMAILGGARPVTAFAGKVATGGLLDATAALALLGIPATSTPPSPTTPPTDGPTATDAGDTLATALPVDIPARIAARIGDGPAAARDVDLYRVTLLAGQRLVADVDAHTLPGSSPLDSYLRLFNDSGMELARNDDFRASLDSYLSFRASIGGTYYIGVSGFTNRLYAASGRATKGAATGAYELVISVVPPVSPGATSGLAVLGARDVASVPMDVFISLAREAEEAAGAATRPARRR